MQDEDGCIHSANPSAPNFDFLRNFVSEQAEDLDYRSQRIEHMKLMIEKLQQMMFGKKSEKVILKLLQL